MADQLPDDIPPDLEESFDAEQASIDIEEVRPSYHEVFYTPTPEVMKAAKKSGSGKTLIMEVDAQKDSVSMYPINTWNTSYDFLKPRYGGLKTITFDGFGYDYAETERDVWGIPEMLPNVFYDQYIFGLGLRAAYQNITDILRMSGVRHLIISRRKNTAFDEKQATLILSETEFEKLCKDTKRITKKTRDFAREIKYVTTNYNLASFLNGSVKEGLQELFKKNATKSANLINQEPSVMDAGLALTDPKEAVDFVTKNSEKLVEQEQETLLKLHNKIELVSFEELIKRYETMLGKKLGEPAWQNLFQLNPFILSMVFSSPITIIQGQASVGGIGIDGSGNTITDFLVANSINYNATVIEIKTPQKDLLKGKSFYRNGVHAVSTDLSGGVNQVLYQRMKFQQNASDLKGNSKDAHFEAYHTTGVLIIGKMPVDEVERRSFELFRGNSKDVVIITFDELFERIKQLHEFLKKTQVALPENN